MDDELEDKVFYQTYVSHMRLLSKLAMGVSPLNSTMAYIWKLMRLYFMRPEVVLFTVICVGIVIYLHMLETWSQNVLHRIGFGFTRRLHRQSSSSASLRSAAERQSWEEIFENCAVYAVQGRRPRMEDRYVIEENLQGTGISFFAIFDGHGGEFAAVYAKDHLVENLYKKINEASDILTGKVPPPSPLLARARCQQTENEKETNKDKENDDEAKDTVTNDLNSEKIKTATAERRQSFKKSLSTADDCQGAKSNCNRDQDVFLNKLNSIVRTRDSFLKKEKTTRPQQYQAQCYIDKDRKINFGKMITDEVLAVDYKLVEKAKKDTNVAGTTALIAVLQNSRLIVANVGDSRGVMCDAKGNAIPLSFDHKPQQTRELKRIQEAGGFIAFKGVWRVAGILATSRAMGDYPLKEKKLVIADPDILTFDLNDHKPKFLILASDGLWDTFSNEEAVAFIKDHLDEPHFGAKTITIESYNRGSVDNITVIVIVFKDGKYHFGSS